MRRGQLGRESTPERMMKELVNRKPSGKCEYVSQDCFLCILKRSCKVYRKGKAPQVLAKPKGA